jgi:phosphatidylglycerophosphatase A
MTTHPESSPQRRHRTFKIHGPLDYLAFVVATGGGAGLLPFAPGTFGSLVGVAVFYGLLTALQPRPQLLQSAVIVVGILLAALGIWAGTRAERIFSRKDAQEIVIDEVCGQVITYSLVAPYLIASATNPTVILAVGFALFRLFDIYKPYPTHRLQFLEGGLGVMADDILAGIYAAVVLSFVPLIAPGLLY